MANMLLTCRSESDVRDDLPSENQQTNHEPTQSIDTQETTQMPLAIPRPMVSTPGSSSVETPAAKLLRLCATPTTRHTRLPQLESLLSKLSLNEKRSSSDLVLAVQECSVPFGTSLQALSVAQDTLYQIVKELHSGDDAYKQLAGLQERARMLLNYVYNLKIRIEISRTRHVQRATSGDSISWADLKEMILEAAKELDSVEDNVKELKQSITWLERDWLAVKMRRRV